MTPKSRRYDQQRLRAALLAEWDVLVERTNTYLPEQLAAPSRLPSWTVGQLIAHIARGPLALTRWLAAPEPEGERTTFDLNGWASKLGGAADQIAEEAVDLDGLRPADTVPDARTALAAADPDRMVAYRFGAMSLTGIILTRLVEAVVHADDLDPQFPHDREALATVTRVLADIMAARVPGASVELRVPPFAVVQCVPGPRHTRGTPPNVVETDPLTWLRLAGGRMTWSEAVAAGAVHASGSRSDLAEYLPLLG